MSFLSKLKEFGNKASTPIKVVSAVVLDWTNRGKAEVRELASFAPLGIVVAAVGGVAHAFYTRQQYWTKATFERVFYTTPWSSVLSWNSTAATVQGLSNPIATALQNFPKEGLKILTSAGEKIVYTPQDTARVCLSEAGVRTDGVMPITNIITDESFLDAIRQTGWLGAFLTGAQWAGYGVTGIQAIFLGQRVIQAARLNKSVLAGLRALFINPNTGGFDLLAYTPLTLTFSFLASMLKSIPNHVNEFYSKAIMENTAQDGVNQAAMGNFKDSVLMLCDAGVKAAGNLLKSTVNSTEMKPDISKIFIASAVILGTLYVGKTLTSMYNIAYPTTDSDNAGASKKETTETTALLESDETTQGNTFPGGSSERRNMPGMGGHYNDRTDDPQYSANRGNDEDPELQQSKLSFVGSPSGRK